MDALLKRIKFKDNYTLDDLKKEKRIIFFDIDSTLGSASQYHGFYSFDSMLEEKRIHFEKFKKELGVNFSFADFIAVERQCLAMFLRTLKETNSVGFCLSSWMVSATLRGDKSNINPLKLISMVFKEEFPEWDLDVIVGGLSTSPEDRAETVEKIITYTGSDGLIIDDSFDRYKNKKRLIGVDGDSGYRFRDHRVILSKWK